MKSIFIKILSLGVCAIIAITAFSSCGKSESENSKAEPSEKNEKEELTETDETEDIKEDIEGDIEEESVQDSTDIGESTEGSGAVPTESAEDTDASTESADNGKTDTAEAPKDYTESIASFKAPADAGLHYNDLVVYYNTDGMIDSYRYEIDGNKFVVSLVYGGDTVKAYVFDEEGYLLDIKDFKINGEFDKAYGVTEVAGYYFYGLDVSEG